MSLFKMNFIGAAAIAAMALCGPVVLHAQNTADSPDIARLMEQAKANALLLDQDAGTLESYTRNKISWQTHARQLERMREHVNDLTGNVDQLNAKGAEGSAWQQEAIDRLSPLMRSMAEHLTATIQHLNDNQNRVDMPAYQEYARGNQVFSDKALTLIRDFVSYGEARQRADSLEQKLSLPAEGAA